jgi:hypothetical protein
MVVAHQHARIFVSSDLGQVDTVNKSSELSRGLVPGVMKRQVT